MSEKQKTIITIFLIAIAIAFIAYTRGGYERSFIDTLR